MLGLLLDGDEKEALRKGRDKQRVPLSFPPPEQSRTEGGGDDESPRQQTPRQGTAEVAGAVRAARTERMPASESVAASPPVVADRAAPRSATPTTTSSPSSSVLRGGGAAAAAPTPASGQLAGSTLPPRSPVPRAPLVTKEFDSSDR